jgi:hypothetical protein
MEYTQARRRENHHCALKNHEWNLLIGQLTVETVVELCDTIAGSDKDKEGCNGEACLKMELATTVQESLDSKLTEHKILQNPPGPSFPSFRTSYPSAPQPPCEMRTQD